MSAETTLGFLEHLYRDGFRSELYDHPSDSLDFDENKVAEFVDRFVEAVSETADDSSDAVGHRIPDALLERFREMGFFGLNIPEEYGGLGFTMSEYLAVVARAAQSDLSYTIVPLGHLSIGIKAVLLFGTDEQKERFLPKAASGETIFAYSLTEARHGSDAKHIETEAVLSSDGDSYVLNGTKTYVTNGNYADAFTVFCRVGGDDENPQLAALVVDRDADGVWVGKDIPKMGLHMSSTTALRFSDVRVPKENVLGSPGDGFKIAMTVLNYGRLGLAAASAGLMRQSCDDMLSRATSRRQFGQEIVAYDLVQEKIARAGAHALGAEGIMYFTARLLESNPRMNVAIESSHAKLYGTTRCWETLYDAMQVAGGAGYLRTMPYEKRMRDFRVTTIFEGTTEIHSTYPALMIARGLAERLGDRGAVGKLAELVSFRLKRELRGIATSNGELRDAVREARRGEALVRSLTATAVRRYRRGITSQEFVLRRITNVSLAVFVLLGVVTLVARRAAGGEVPTETRAAVAYLTEEARELLERGPGTATQTPLEEATHRLVKALGA